MVRSLVGRLPTDDRLRQFAQNWKFDARMMSAAGLQVKAPDGDPMIAGYLLDPVARNVKLDDLARVRLGHEMLPYAAVAGELPHFGYVDLEKACAYAAEDADATLRLALHMEPEAGGRRGLGKLYDEVEAALEPRPEPNGGRGHRAEPRCADRA